MSKCYMETACTRCAHRKVCICKEQFLKAQKKVNDLRIIDEDVNTVIYVKDIAYIEPVVLKCRMYLREPRSNSKQIYGELGG